MECVGLCAHTPCRVSLAHQCLPGSSVCVRQCLAGRFLHTVGPSSKVGISFSCVCPIAICWGMGSVLTGKVLLDKGRPLNHPLCSRLTEILVSQPPGEAGVCVCAGHGTVQEYLCPRKATLHQGRRIKVLPWVLLHNKTQSLTGCAWQGVGERLDVGLQLNNG